MAEIKPQFPNKKTIEEAYGVNELVDEYFKNPKTKKNKTPSEVAHQIIKERKSRSIWTRNLSPEERVWLDNLRAMGIQILNDGFLEIIRWDSNEGTKIPIRQKIDGINSAIRMQDYILEKYGLQRSRGGGEIEQLESIQKIIEKANQLLNNWKRSTPREREKIQQELANIVLQLEYCRNEFKIETRDQIDEVVGLKDSRDRENPMALAARTIAALNNLDRRLTEIRAIKPRIALRREILIFEKRRQQNYIKRAIGKIGFLIHHQIFGKSANSNPERFIEDYEIRFFNKSIREIIFNLEKVSILPYKQQAEQAKFFLLQNVKRFLVSKQSIITNREFIKKSLLDVLNILKSDMENLG